MITYDTSVFPEIMGFDLLRQQVPMDEIHHLRQEVDRLTEGSETAGVRGWLKDSPLLQELSRTLRDQAGLPEDHVCVRGILFNKTPRANWPVAWHQDLTIAVQDRKEIPGYGPWTRKEDFWQVQPPLSTLQKMWTLRLHLDHALPENGPLRVLPGSHRHGRLNSEQIRKWAQDCRVVTCSAWAGDLLRMRPMLLHASSRSERPSLRRVIHLEYAPADVLPEELEWGEAVVESP